MTERETRFAEQEPNRPKQSAHQDCHESSLKDHVLAEESALQMEQQRLQWAAALAFQSHPDQLARGRSKAVRKTSSGELNAGRPTKRTGKGSGEKTDQINIKNTISRGNCHLAPPILHVILFATSV